MKKRKLKIALFASIDQTIPPPGNIINAPMTLTKNLARGLLRKGHRVTLFAVKNSHIQGVKIYTLDYKWDKNLKVKDTDWVSYTKFSPSFLNYELQKDIKKFYNQMAISEIYLKQKEFDLIHFNYSEIDNIVPFAKLFKIPILIVIHDFLTPLRKVVLKKVREFKNIRFVSISNSQRKPYNQGNFIETIYHGVDTQKYQFNPKPGNYLLFSGRLLYKKGVDVAIRVARKSKTPLKIIGTINDLSYYNKSIKPYLNKDIQYLGVKSGKQLSSLYQSARALLFPIKWEEPFGLVMTEAMACGTPAIGFDRGAVREIIKDGKTGFIVKNPKEMVEAVKKIGQIDRLECRRWVEEKFSIGKMIDEYEKVYYKILRENKKL